jgi:hypothetical protein
MEPLCGVAAELKNELFAWLSSIFSNIPMGREKAARMRLSRLAATAYLLRLARVLADGGAHAAQLECGRQCRPEYAVNAAACTFGLSNRLATEFR